MTAPRAVLVSGHMIDAPNRAQPRFPQRLASVVADRIGSAFDAWGVAAGTTLICGGARGADVLAAEAALARGGQVIVCLALDPDAFEAASVALPGTDWSERYRRLLQVADVRHPAGADPDD